MDPINPDSNKPKVTTGSNSAKLGESKYANSSQPGVFQNIDSAKPESKNAGFPSQKDTTELLDSPLLSVRPKKRAHLISLGAVDRSSTALLDSTLPGGSGNHSSGTKTPRQEVGAKGIPGKDEDSDGSWEDQDSDDDQDKLTIDEPPAKKGRYFSELFNLQSFQPSILFILFPKMVLLFKL